MSGLLMSGLLMSGLLMSGLLRSVNPVSSLLTTAGSKLFSKKYQYMYVFLCLSVNRAGWLLVT
jgi:hypothetical protein